VLRGLNGQETRRLLDDQEVRVLEQHDEPALHAPPFGTAGIEPDFDILGDVQPRLVPRDSADVDPARADGVARSAPGELEPAGDEEIEPHVISGDLAVPRAPRLRFIAAWPAP
jgi:hypothetical protein